MVPPDVALQDLAAPEVPYQPFLASGAEGTADRTADLAGQAQGVAFLGCVPVEIAHYDHLQGVSIIKGQQELDRLALAVGVRLTGEGQVGDY